MAANISIIDKLKEKVRNLPEQLTDALAESKDNTMSDAAKLLSPAKNTVTERMSNRYVSTYEVVAVTIPLRTPKEIRDFLYEFFGSQSASQIILRNLMRGNLLKNSKLDVTIEVSKDSDQCNNLSVSGMSINENEKYVLASYFEPSKVRELKEEIITYFEKAEEMIYEAGEDEKDDDIDYGG